ncbi:ArsR/SmtB family transcription factor [Nonomuraea cavernae]|uniref:Transcriptional regulator n=1 Tax=Nonomuraea cavernae TaxID=2045107 RepID=A0A918DJE3_9ACTN|nr:helix-turn-helix domain-containing protein [Nonomuraea cavernae]MCA2185873.1 helix-turn-helix domain-containing protein [Nonomuraea cavernae]GGO69348.1 transcriptional regulator [Nonomuraea cavernae]
MLRIYFTSDDIARTRIATGPDPLWELVLGLQMLRPQRGDLLFTAWRREACRAVRQAKLGEMLNLLLALSPNVGYFPDFLNPSKAIHGLDQGIEALRSTPVTMLKRDVRRLAATRRLPSNARRVADGEPAMLTDLTEAMRICYELIVLPYRRSVDAALERERRIRASALAAGGVEGLLTSLRPMMTWSSGELRIPGHRDQELHLHGRGLLLIPTYFCVSGPLTMLDPDLPPVLVYPAVRGPEAVPSRASGVPAALGALIGSTRAAVLEAVGTREETSTTVLARHLGISLASASEHTTVLRHSGLVFSHRDHNRTLHHLTDLGRALLEANADALLP